VVHIDRLGMAARLAVVRQELLAQMDSNDVSITINGKAQDAEFVGRMRPYMNRLVNEQVSQVETHLRELGVNVP